jgi:hypothetical protein
MSGKRFDKYTPEQRAALNERMNERPQTIRAKSESNFLKMGAMPTTLDAINIDQALVIAREMPRAKADCERVAKRLGLKPTAVRTVSEAFRLLRRLGLVDSLNPERASNS